MTPIDYDSDYTPTPISVQTVPYTLPDGRMVEAEASRFEGFTEYRIGCLFVTVPDAP